MFIRMCYRRPDGHCLGLFLYLQYFFHNKKNKCTLCVQYYVILVIYSKRSRYSDWLRAERPRGRISSPGGVKIVLFFTSSRLALGFTQHPSQWIPGAFSAVVKGPGREGDHSPPATADVKKVWINISAPHTPSWRSA
jgi:hypothetical protein